MYVSLERVRYFRGSTRVFRSDAWNWLYREYIAFLGGSVVLASIESQYYRERGFPGDRVVALPTSTCVGIHCSSELIPTEVWFIKSVTSVNSHNCLSQHSTGTYNAFPRLEPPTLSFHLLLFPLNIIRSVPKYPTLWTEMIDVNLSNLKTEARFTTTFIWIHYPLHILGIFYTSSANITTNT